MAAEDLDFFSNVAEFVHWSGGDHAIEKILIANNGIGATKAIKSIRRWAFDTFGNERAIKFVVMATPEDMRANAEYIRMADQVVDVPGGSNNNNYANVSLICEIAERLKVDAVMPMWGHASENPNLPTSLNALKHRVTFIGPAAEPMQALGDKIGSTIIAQSAGVPTIAWNGDGLHVDYQKTGIPPEVYDAANVKTAEDALDCALRIGFPVMIKASEGGGGKGIRKVVRAEEVLNSFRQVQGEIPGSPIFVMKMASKARHLEVQLLADKHGEAIALSGRDCSVQRRHQKIIEEGPPTAAPVNVFKIMERAACSLAKTVGYCNAGTVEYLYMEETKEFAFLELNPRLQVEHPVTENILGINLPACQLQVAMGIPLHRIFDIRRLYGRHPKGLDTIDFNYAERVAPARHCIAVRVTAENPEAGFQPTSGKIQELQFKSSIDVWGYFSVDNSGLVHEFADSQFGHIFAGGRNREAARRAMIVALKELQIRGAIRTTIEYIIKMLQADDFVQNRIDTAWLDGRLAMYKELAVIENKKFCPPPTLVALCGIALQGFKHFDTRDKTFVNLLTVGQIPSQDTLSPSIPIDLIFDNVKYMATCVQNGPEKIVIKCNNAWKSVNIRPLADGGFMLNASGKNHLVYAQDESSGSLRMILDGHTCIFTPEYDPTKFVSSVAGKIARLLVDEGSHVQVGDAFVEIEVMKMYMPLRAQEAGFVHFQKSEGATLNPGDIVANFTLDHPDKVIRAEEFKGVLGEEGADECTEFIENHLNLPHLKLRETIQDIEKVLAGFPLTENEINAALKAYIDSRKHPLLPVLRVEESLSVLRGRIDADLFATIADLNTNYKECVAQNAVKKYPAGEMLASLHGFSVKLTPDKRPTFITQTMELWNTIEQFLFTTDELIIHKLVIFLEGYLAVEKLFDGLSFSDVVTTLRKDNNSDLSKVLDVCRSHANIKAKNVLVLAIIDTIKGYPINNVMKRPELPTGVIIRNELQTRKLKTKLQEFVKLRQTGYSHVSFAANLLLMDQFNLSVEARRHRLNDAIIAALATGDEVGHGERIEELQKFIDSNVVVQDLLIESLRQDPDYQIAAMELYLRKIYQQSHLLFNVSAGKSLKADDRFPWMTFEFLIREILEVQNVQELTKKPYLSILDLTTIANTKAIAKTNRASELRAGVLVALESFDELPRAFPSIIEKIPLTLKREALNVIHVVVLDGLAGASNDEVCAYLSNFLSPFHAELSTRCIRRVTFVVGKPPNNRGRPVMPDVFTFRERTNFLEDRLFRHVEASHAYNLDLLRLSNFNISLEEGTQTTSGNVHLYKALPKGGKGYRRYFARIVCYSADSQSNDLETLYVEALDQLGLALGKEETTKVKASHIVNINAANHFYLNVVSPDSVFQPEAFEGVLRKLCTKYWYRMVRFAVTTVELRVTARISMDTEPLYMRLVASNPTGFVLKIDKYVELRVGDNLVFKSIAKPGPWEGLHTLSPYEPSQKFEIQRAEAMASSDTLYVYDWPILFESAAEKQWNEHTSSRVNTPDDFFSCQELVMHDKNTYEPLMKGWTADYAKSHGVLLPVHREPGLNDAGMVAWHLKVCTPEFPEGRELIIICNDITYQAGSFGTKEDMIFFKASEYARIRGIPRIFLAANSGARIGMAQSLKSKFQICFTDEMDPAKGYKYIYLNAVDYEELLEKAGFVEKNLPVICSPLEVNGVTRYVITDIIGEEPDLGVENLMGSGLIAGETSKAYDDIFTLTMVVGRTVGIGAYLVRLGQRTIQKTRHAPIILTGYQALNKLMGREIYTTNDQLGGPMIMYPNGVSHLLAETHYDAVVKGLEWLSFVPAKRGGALARRVVLPLSDPVDRLVTFAPQKGVAYDPRLLLTGYKPSMKDETSWRLGFFDQQSFVETLGGWAKTVVVGRGRLGGIPLGVIVTENRTAEVLKPADPADATSQEKLVQQAGGVWFPDSAYKTAQALRDFNREGLPCIIFANWRGFSGGQRDMYDEVLKFGSMIVDALVAYQQPLFVYIPPFSELRGGAWVVVDSTINADVMEFYAAEDARGGVLEAAGAASIKFRDRDIVATAHRVDHVLIQLDQKVTSAMAAAGAGAATSEVEDIQRAIRHREKQLFGVYQQIAVHFADLHDTPGRMKAKGVIRKLVPWAESRTYFYWRLTRRLREFELYDTVMKDIPLPARVTRKEFISELQSVFAKSVQIEHADELDMAWDNDRKVLAWLQDQSSSSTSMKEFTWMKRSALQVQQITTRLQDLVKNAAAVSSSSSSSSSSVVSLLQQSLQSFSPEEKALLQAALQQ